MIFWGGAILNIINDIDFIAPLFWADHCLECSAPLCYSSCVMFEENHFGRCKRVHFVKERTDTDALLPVVCLKYKKWAKLRCAYNNSNTFEVNEFKREYLSYRKKISSLSVIDKRLDFLRPSLKYPLSRLLHHQYIKRFVSGREKELCKELCIILYYHGDEPCKLILDSLDCDNTLLTRTVREFQKGFQIWRISHADLTRDNKKVCALELYPNNNTEPEITFFLSDLITFKSDSAFNMVTPSFSSPAPKVKCVVWDLDNTIWNGIIGEDGLDGISIRPEALNVICELDKRGIIQTICSKNEEKLAVRGLEKFGIREYFVYSHINWKPKSENLIEISKMLNINIDTFAFIDDSKIERNEINTFCPCVRVYTEKEIQYLLERPEFDVPITEDSAKRRLFYLSESNRKVAYTKSVDQDYRAFIKSCEIVVTINECKEENDIKRCHELLMRTNQLNSSTNRISYEDFIKIIKDPKRIVYKLTGTDRYGEYGTIGCLIIKPRPEGLICTDFVISCRVAKRKVESAVIMRLMQEYDSSMDIVYIPSERNNVLKEEFLKIGANYLQDDNLMHFTEDIIVDYDWLTVRTSTD